MTRPQKLAEKTSKRGEHWQHRVGAVIVLKSGKVVFGWNKNKTHPKSTHPWHSLHAEMDVILKAKTDLCGARLYVARLGKNGSLRNAKPCPACMAMIVASGISTIHFTDDGKWNAMGVR